MNKGQMMSSDAGWLQGYVAFLGFIVAMSTLGAPVILEDVPDPPVFTEINVPVIGDIIGYLLFAIGNIAYFFELMFVTFGEFPLVFSVLFLPLIIRVLWMLLNFRRGG